MKDPDLMPGGLHDRWYTWRWDFTEAPRQDGGVIKRWRRGSFLTIYFSKNPYEYQWAFYGPFNFGIAFAFPRRGSWR